jgi:uncharacterized membrane protein YidH (DUF202 family)
MTSEPPGAEQTTASPLSDVALERDDGLSVERTELAWTRSGLALLGVFAILARRVWSTGVQAEDSILVVLFALATLGWAIGVLGHRRTFRSAPGMAPRSAHQLLAVALGTVAIAAAGIVASIVNV